MSEDKINHSEMLPSEIKAGERGLQLDSLDSMLRFAEGLVRSNMAPKGMQAGGVVAIMQAGQEIGLPHMQALSQMTFVNGRLGIMGTGALALIRASGVLEEGTDITWDWQGGEPGSDDYHAIVFWTRRGQIEKRAMFSVRDARKAGLWGKQGPWRTDPDMMLMWRAVGRMVKLGFSDVMMGVSLSEEIRDYAPIPGDPPRREPMAALPEPEGVDPLLAALGVESPEGELIPVGTAGEEALGAQDADTGPKTFGDPGAEEPEDAVIIPDDEEQEGTPALFPEEQ
jgi:hypothetical protein